MPQLAADHWGSQFPGLYAARSRAASDARKLQREQARARRAGAAPPSGSDRAMAQLRRERHRSRAALIELRINRGYVWHGGAVGGDQTYHRPAFCFHGLVSPQHPILELFVTKTRRAAGLITGDTKAEASGTDSKLLALDSAYTEANKAMRGVLRVELDEVFASPEALTAAIQATGVPLPNLVVGYRDRRGRLHRPHLLWLLASSVCFTTAGQAGHKALWRKVLGGLTAALLPLGADPGGLSNPLRMKNPLSPLWDRFILADLPYSLADDQREAGDGFPGLARHLPISEQRSRLQSAKETFRPSLEADHPDPVVAVGSNGLFRHLAAYAREQVAGQKVDGSEAEFTALLGMEAMRLCRSGQAAERAALRLAGTVAHWTWRHYRLPGAPRAMLNPEQRLARREAAGRSTAESRRRATLGALLRAAKRLLAGKRKVSQPAVARLSRRSIRTVERHWKSLAISLQKVLNCPSNAAAVDKKKVQLPDGQAAVTPVASQDGAAASPAEHAFTRQAAPCMASPLNDIPASGAAPGTSRSAAAIPSSAAGKQAGMAIRPRRGRLPALVCHDPGSSGRGLGIGVLGHPQPPVSPPVTPAPWLQPGTDPNDRDAVQRDFLDHAPVPWDTEPGWKPCAVAEVASHPGMPSTSFRLRRQPSLTALPGDQRGHGGC